MPSGYSVAVEHVSYSYDGTKNALHDVSLSIRQGQTVALVGESGGGKTTLANLVTRFLIRRKGVSSLEIQIFVISPKKH